jgi:hypothetical protein
MTRPRRYRWVNLSLEGHRFCRTIKVRHDRAQPGRCLCRLDRPLQESASGG